MRCKIVGAVMSSAFDADVRSTGPVVVRVISSTRYP
jgi:hypothetical protein